MIASITQINVRAVYFMACTVITRLFIARFAGVILGRLAVGLSTKNIDPKNIEIEALNSDLPFFFEALNSDLNGKKKRMKL